MKIKVESNGSSKWEYIEKTETSDEIFGSISDGGYYVRHYDDNMSGYIYPPSGSQQLYRAKLSCKTKFDSLGYNAFLELSSAKEFLDNLAVELSPVTFEDIKQQLEEIDTHEFLVIDIDNSPVLNNTKVTITGTLINGEEITFYDSSYLRTQRDIDFIKQKYAEACKSIDLMRERGYLGVKEEALTKSSSKNLEFKEAFLSAFEKIVNKYSDRFNFRKAVGIDGNMGVFDVYVKDTVDCIGSAFVNKNSYEGVSSEELENAIMKAIEAKIEQFAADIKIESKHSNDYDELSDTYWYGRYTDMKGTVKKIIVKIPTQDYDEADKEFEAYIPEPYIEYKLWGDFTRKDSYLGKQLPKEGYEYITESITDKSSDMSDAQAVIDKFSNSQVTYVKAAFNACIREDMNSGEKVNSSMSSQLRNDWVADAIADELLTEEEFNTLWDAVKTIEEGNVPENVTESKSQMTAPIFFDNITSGVVRTFGCDVDDLNYDDNLYPNTAKASFAVYNVSTKTARSICDWVEKFLTSNGYDCYRSDAVTYEIDFDYSSIVKCACIIAINVPLDTNVGIPQLEATERKNFNFKCSSCHHEFVAEYDYPLPTDCNAAVYCPRCNGVARVTQSEPVTPQLESFGDFNITEPSSFAPNGRSYYSNPEDWEQKHAWTKEYLSSRGYRCKGSSPWNSTWTNGNSIEDIRVDYWDDFNVIREYVRMSVEG